MNIIKRMIYNSMLPITGTLLKNKNKYINVIYYHDIVKGNGGGAQYTNIDIFKIHMNYIVENGYNTYTFDELDNGADISFQSKSVLITFDDGWLSNYKEIFEFMKEKNIKYNIYLAVSEIGNNPDYLTWDMVREMHESGLVGFGAHTYSHVSVQNIAEVNKEIEFDLANKKFYEELGYEPIDFCYPYGQYTKESNDYLVNDTIYKRIYTSDLMFSYEQSGKIIFGRSSINNDEPFKTFINKLKGNYNAFNLIRGK
ncbi:MAG: polysaccharide deacetylase family protein [Clostridia bacterium]|nr:polysaccharide deacetylase family protein [Clostridia bacterium]